MKYSINFMKQFNEKGRYDGMTWHDDNIFKTYKEALIFAMDMVEYWRKADKELITFQVISH